MRFSAWHATASKETFLVFKPQSRSPTPHQPMTCGADRPRKKILAMHCVCVCVLSTTIYLKNRLIFLSK
jgi:hypothetical protein